MENRQYLITNGIPVIDADQVARDVVVPGSKGLDTVIKHFGLQFLNLDGTLNRESLGRLVFSNPASLEELNNIMGPLIEEEARIQFNKLKNDGCKVAVWDAALIVENGNHERYCPLIAVSCPPEVQLERLMKHNSLTEEQAMARISAQIPAEKKAEFADYVINTGGSIELSVQQTLVVIYELKLRFVN